MNVRVTGWWDGAKRQRKRHGDGSVDIGDAGAER